MPDSPFVERFEPSTAGDDAPPPPFGSEPPTGSRRLWWATALVACGLAVLHFALLLVWLVPGDLAPFLRRAAHVYVAPVFAQNWWLFAPDPPAVERRIEVRGAYASDGGRRFTAWFPLTGSLTAAVQRNPLSPKNASWIAVLNATYALADPMGPLRLRGAARDLVVQSFSDPARQPTGLLVLERAGSVALAAAHPGLRLDRVQVRLTVRHLPSFAERAAPSAAAVDELLFPWVPIATEFLARGSEP
jgi:hypothetical protein